MVKYLTATPGGNHLGKQLANAPRGGDFNYLGYSYFGRVAEKRRQVAAIQNAAVAHFVIGRSLLDVGSSLVWPAVRAYGVRTRKPMSAPMAWA